MPFMKHPDLDAHIEVASQQVPVLEKSGWQAIDLVDLPKSELIGVAEKRGAPTKKSASKAEIAKAVTSIEPEEG